MWVPGKGNEPSTITDFRGDVAVADILGTGTGTDTPDDPAVGLIFDADMRFMQGLYVGRDGRLRQGSFGFI